MEVVIRGEWRGQQEGNWGDLVGWEWSWGPHREEEKAAFP